MSIGKQTKLKSTLEIIAELKEEDLSSQIVEIATNGQFNFTVLSRRESSKIEALLLGNTLKVLPIEQDAQY